MFTRSFLPVAAGPSPYPAGPAFRQPSSVWKGAVIGSQNGYVHPSGGNRPIRTQNHIHLDGYEVKKWMLETLGREAMFSPTG